MREISDYCRKTTLKKTNKRNVFTLQLSVKLFWPDQTLAVNLLSNARLRVYCHESESDIASGWAHKESNLMFTVSSDKDQSEKFAFTCFSPFCVFAVAQCKRTIMTFCLTRTPNNKVKLPRTLTSRLTSTELEQRPI